MAQTPYSVIPSQEYQTVAPSQTAQALGPTGGKSNDLLQSLIVVPESLSPGKVTLIDGSGSGFAVYFGGATSITDITPVTIEFNIRSVNGPWKITTGAAVNVIALGDFT